jgi:hypothetical protein
MVLRWDFGERRGWRSNRSPKLIPQGNPYGHPQKTGYRVSDRRARSPGRPDTWTARSNLTGCRDDPACCWHVAGLNYILQCSDSGTHRPKSD